MVSILLPAFKSKFLEETILSVISQTYTNWELIIVNDKSPEDIDSIIDKFSEDKRIHYYKNEENLGKKDLTINWNKCLGYAKGEFVCLICDDDIYDPSFLEEMLSLAKQYPQCNVFRSGVKIVDRNNATIDYYPSSPSWENCESYMWHVFHKYRCQTVSEWFYRTSHIKSLGGFCHLPLAWYSDFLSTFKFALVGGIASTTKHLVKFRMSGDNITSQKDKNTIDKMTASLYFEKEVNDMLDKNNFENNDIIKSLMRKYLREKRTYSLSSCKFSDWLYFLINKNQFKIDIKMILNSLIRRTII